MLHSLPRSRVTGLRNALLLLGAATVVNCGGPTSEGVSDDSVIAAFDMQTGDKTGTRNAAVVLPVLGSHLSVRTGSTPGSGRIRFDVYDVKDIRIFGLDTEWTSSDPKVVAVEIPHVTTYTELTLTRFSTYVTLQGLSRGDAILTGTVVGAKTLDDKPVTVKVPIHVTGPAIRLVPNPRAIVAQLGDADPHLYADAFDEMDEMIVNPDFIWECLDDPSVAGIASSPNPICTQTSTRAQGAIIHGLKAGTARFRVSLEGAPSITDVVTVVFMDKGMHLAVDPPIASVVVGGHVQLRGLLVDDAGKTYPAAGVQWTSRNTAVATADLNSGSVTGLTSGVSPGKVETMTIQAKLDVLIATAVITVYRAPARVLVHPALTLKPGESAAVIAELMDTDDVTLIPSGATKFTWSVDQAAIATVLNGTVTAVSAGDTQVRARTAEGLEGVAAVTVTGPVVSPRCYPDCVQNLKEMCIPVAPCTTHATPPAPYSTTFNFCYSNGVKVTGMSTNTGSRHTQRKAGGSVCYIIDSTFGNSGETTYTWFDGTGTMQAIETFNSQVASGSMRTVACGNQTYNVDLTDPVCAEEKATCTEDATCN